MGLARIQCGNDNYQVKQTSTESNVKFSQRKIIIQVPENTFIRVSSETSDFQAASKGELRT